MQGEYVKFKKSFLFRDITITWLNGNKTSIPAGNIDYISFRALSADDMLTDLQKSADTICRDYNFNSVKDRLEMIKKLRTLTGVTLREAMGAIDESMFRNKGKKQ